MFELNNCNNHPLESEENTAVIKVLIKSYP